MVEDNEVTSIYSQLVNPGILIENSKITEITGIDNSMIKDAPDLEDEMRKLHQVIKGKLLVAHNAPFDMGFLNNTFYRMGLPTFHSYLCTAQMFRAYKKSQNVQLERASLAVMTAHFEVLNASAHRAGADAEATAKSFLKMCEKLDYRDFMEGAGKRSKNINELSAPSKTDIYMWLFDQGMPIEAVCQEMKVKIGTVMKYFLMWLHYGDASIYKTFVLEQLPETTMINEILRLKAQGKTMSNIHNTLGREVEYHVIQLVGRLGTKGIKKLNK